MHAIHAFTTVPKRPAKAALPIHTLHSQLFPPLGKRLLVSSGPHISTLVNPQHIYVVHLPVVHALPTPCTQPALTQRDPTVIVVEEPAPTPSCSTNQLNHPLHSPMEGHKQQPGSFASSTASSALLSTRHLPHSISLESRSSNDSSASLFVDIHSPDSIASALSDTSVASEATALEARHKHYGPNAALSYSQPLLLERGEGCYLYDDQGRQYLDCVNNVAHVGHANLQVAGAVSSQLCRLNTNSRYLSRELNLYCEELTATLPHPLKVVYLVNSGSEANDLALRIAAAAAAAADNTPHSPGSLQGSSSSTGAPTAAAEGAAAGGPIACVGGCGVREHVVVMSGAYHGHLTSMISLSPYKFWGPGGAGKPDWVHVMPAPDTYRGINLDGAAAARGVLAQAAAAGGRVVAFFCESIISCGGQLMLPPGYLAGVYSVMRAAGVVCVADEVQTGFGRTGDMWAFQQQGVVPDIVTLGKPMGNGFPIGGVVTSPALAAAFSNGMEYFNTYGGNNAAVAAGRAVLRELRDKGLQQQAAEVGSHLLSSLQQLQRQFPALIGDVRGAGLFAGLELVTCPTAKTPAPLAAKALKEGAKARGVLLSSDGPVGHVVKIKPPMVFGVAEVDHMVQVMREVLCEMTCPPAWQELMEAEQQQHSSHVAPILQRYQQNEQQVWAAAAALATADEQQQGPKPLGGSSASLSEADCCSIILLPAVGPEAVEAEATKVSQCLAA